MVYPRNFSHSSSGTGTGGSRWQTTSSFATGGGATTSMPSSASSSSTSSSTTSASSSYKTSQFGKLEAEKRSYDQATRAAQDAYVKADTRFQALQQQHRNLQEHAARESAAVGALHSQTQAWMAEKQRLQRVLHAEREELKTCAQQEETLLQSSRQHKDEFNKTMRDLNLEFSSLLRKHEDLRLQRFITVDTIPALIQVLSLQPSSPTSSTDSASDNSLHPNDADATGTAPNGTDGNRNSCPPKIIAEVQEASEVLTKVTREYQESMEAIRALETSVDGLRQRALQRSVASSNTSLQPPLTHQDLLKLEESWKSQQPEWQPPPQEGEEDSLGFHHHQDNRQGDHHDDRILPLPQPTGATGHRDPHQQSHLDLFYQDSGGHEVGGGASMHHHTTATTGPAMTPNQEQQQHYDGDFDSEEEDTRSKMPPPPPMFPTASCSSSQSRMP